MSSTDHGGGKRRGDFIAALPVDNKPQMSADYFSVLKFIGSNLAFAATTPKMLPRLLEEAARGEAASFLSSLAAGSGGTPRNQSCVGPQRDSQAQVMPERAPFHDSPTHKTFLLPPT
jgi:hypothetical protein